MVSVIAPIRSVLVIEDDRDYADSLVELLELKGYRAASAPNASLAWECINRSRPDLILLDFTLPDSSGADVGRVLRETEKWARIPIVIESGMPEWVVRNYFSQFDAFLAKPMNVEKLFESIAELIGTSEHPTERRAKRRG